MHSNHGRLAGWGASQLHITGSHVAPSQRSNPVLPAQANILFGKELARRLQEEGSPLLAVSLHPGG